MAGFSSLCTRLAELYDADDTERFPTRWRSNAVRAAMRRLLRSVTTDILVTEKALTLDGSDSYALADLTTGEEVVWRVISVEDQTRDDDPFLDELHNVRALSSINTTNMDQPEVWAIGPDSTIHVAPDTADRDLTAAVIMQPEDDDTGILNVVEDAILYLAGKYAAPHFAEDTARVELILRLADEEEAKAKAFLQRRMAGGLARKGRR